MSNIKLVFLSLIVFFYANMVNADSDSKLIGVGNIIVSAMVSDDAISASLTDSKVKTEVELLLRTYGVALANKDDSVDAVLSIDVRSFFEYTVSGKLQGYYSVIDASLYEKALVDRGGRSSNTSQIVTTWNYSKSVTGPKDSLVSQNMEAITDIVKKFSNEYLKDNRK
ncbi:hypothetical protein KO537_09645 [Shewanella sp. NKUCC01_JLK]|uniref:hypothetical protein n=1 Tax=Shewanella sp. NKUCC01_JLK TaxID=2842123 RepID=UPI001C5BAE0B|nr:hypothetical protein [Shewanella sp. NKUCC01_JLK]MBW3514985.1 hypothetical protein [Shewanella sp. NKUCC01_JLK]